MANKVQITTDAVRVPRLVLGKNADGKEVYLYYDESLQRVVIANALGLVYEQVSASGSQLYALDVTSPSFPVQVTEQIGDNGSLNF